MKIEISDIIVLVDPKTGSVYSKLFLDPVEAEKYSERLNMKKVTGCFICDKELKLKS